MERIFNYLNIVVFVYEIKRRRKAQDFITREEKQIVKSKNVYKN